MMRRGATAGAVALGATLLAAACAPAEPAAVAAVGLDDSGYLAVVIICDEGRTVTHAGFVESEADAPELSWIGRTVEPITFFRVAEDPPDNWVLDVEGGLRSDVAYGFEATDGDLVVAGPTFTLDDLNTLGAGEVIDPDGVVLSIDEFLDTAC